MARSDYRCCDVCDGKVFYDSNLDYEFEGQSTWGGEVVKNDDCTNVAGVHPPEWCGYKLQYLGDWAVICHNCAKTHKCVIVPIEEKEGGSPTTD